MKHTLQSWQDRLSFIRREVCAELDNRFPEDAPAFYRALTDLAADLQKALDQVRAVSDTLKG